MNEKIIDFKLSVLRKDIDYLKKNIVSLNGKKDLNKVRMGLVLYVNYHLITNKFVNQYLENYHKLSLDRFKIWINML